jgi:glutathione S-transferase
MTSPTPVGSTASPEVSLYGHWICPFVLRVQFALEQRGIAYELVDLPPSGVRPRDFVLPPEFVEHSPKLEVPMLRIGDEYRADSIPILEWMETALAHPPLLPADDVGRALVRERVEWIDHHAFRAMVGIYYGHEPHRIAAASAALADAFSVMATWLEGDADAPGTGWLAGAAPSLAEAVTVPIYIRLDMLRYLGFAGEIPRAVMDHVERTMTLPGGKATTWTRAQSMEFLERFEAHRERRRRAS